jgi:hypothetical protein
MVVPALFFVMNMLNYLMMTHNIPIFGHSQIQFPPNEEACSNETELKDESILLKY